LVDDIDAPTVVVRGGRILQRLPDPVADTAEFTVPEHVRFLTFEGHAVVRGQARALRNQHDRIAARVPVAVVREELREPLDVDGVLRNDASIGCARHRR